MKRSMEVELRWYHVNKIHCHCHCHTFNKDLKKCYSSTGRDVILSSTEVLPCIIYVNKLLLNGHHALFEPVQLFLKNFEVILFIYNMHKLTNYIIGTTANKLYLCILIINTVNCIIENVQSQNFHSAGNAHKRYQ